MSLGITAAKPLVVPLVVPSLGHTPTLRLELTNSKSVDMGTHVYTVIPPPLREGCIISGSFALHVLLSVMGKTPTWKPDDVDVFCRTPADHGRLILHLIRSGFVCSPHKGSPAVINCVSPHGDSLPIQAICSSHNATMDSVLGGFDLACCRVAIAFEGGVTVLYAEVEQALLGVPSHLTVPTPMLRGKLAEKSDAEGLLARVEGSVARAEKYRARGFKITEVMVGTKKELLNVYANAFRAHAASARLQEEAYPGYTCYAFSGCSSGCLCGFCASVKKTDE